MTQEELNKESFEVRKAVAAIALIFKQLQVSSADGKRACEVVAKYVSDKEN